MTGKPYLRQLYKIEQKYYPLILRALKAYANAYADDLQTNGQQATGAMQSQLFNQALTPIILDLYQKTGLWGARLQNGELKEAVKNRQKAGGFGINESWIQEVLNYLAKFALQFIQNITETTKNDLLKVLEKGTEENLSLDEIIRNIRALGILPVRARTIARTEIVRAANVGHRIGARSFPYEVNKKWLSATDHRTRHSHMLINKQVVDEEGLFKVAIYKGDKPTGSFDEMNAPGDPNASAANSINCRCRVIYTPKEDANGQLIMRQASQAVVIPMRTQPRYTPAQIAAQLKANIVMGVDAPKQ
jgi:hypothetical protein